MAVLGKGHAHGACSLLHAAGTGYGAAMALDLPVFVRLLDKPSTREVHDGAVCSRLFWMHGSTEAPLPEGFQEKITESNPMFQANRASSLQQLFASLPFGPCAPPPIHRLRTKKWSLWPPKRSSLQARP